MPEAASERSARVSTFLRGNWVGLCCGLLLAALGFGAVRWISSRDRTTVSRKTPQFTMVKILPDRPARPPPPAKAPEPQRKVEEPRSARVELKANELVAPPSNPAPAPAPSGGRLSLAAAGQGQGDAFNLVGNPGGRGLLSGGGLGDGSGDGDGLGGGGPGARFGPYYAKVALEVEETFRRAKRLNMLSGRLELRIWIDGEGRVSRIVPIREDVDPRVKEALQSIVGLRIGEPPPAGIPMPMVARLTARRPQ